MTAASSDGPKMAKHHTNKEQRRGLAERMKDPDDCPETGHRVRYVADRLRRAAPAHHVHRQAHAGPQPDAGHCARQPGLQRQTRRPDRGLSRHCIRSQKSAIVLLGELRQRGDPAEAQEQAVAAMLEKLEVVSQMFHGFAYEEYFGADTSRKLALILAAEDFILGLEDGRRRYINEVTALSQAFAIAIPHEEAMDVKDEVAFFQAVKARLVKFDASGTGRTNEELETAIRQVIDQALVSDKVIDIFDAAGLKKPDISILSEEFLLEIKNMEHKNVAMEVLRKLLNDEIKARARTNLVESKSLMEMLEQSLKRYHNKAITSAQVIEELINLGKEIKNMKRQARRNGLERVRIRLLHRRCQQRKRPRTDAAR